MIYAMIITYTHSLKFYAMIITCIYYMICAMQHALTTLAARHVRRWGPNSARSRLENTFIMQRATQILPRKRMHQEAWTDPVRWTDPVL
jgi:hypothetical protein